jgi:hypothetical protein
LINSNLKYLEKLEKEPSTTKLLTKQFAEYLEKIVIFASTELGITLPNPEDLRFKEFEEYYSQYL